MRDWWPLVKGAAVAWVADYAPSMGAALSYYSVFSLAPLLLIVISIAGLVFGQEAVRGEVFAQLQGLLGAEASGRWKVCWPACPNPPRAWPRH
jgi:membrane protein